MLARLLGRCGATLSGMSGGVTVTLDAGDCAAQAGIDCGQPLGH